MYYNGRDLNMVSSYRTTSSIPNFLRLIEGYIISLDLSTPASSLRPKEPIELQPMGSQPMGPKPREP